MEELLLQMNDGQIVNNLDSYEFAITESLKKYNYVVDENNYAQAKDDRARLNESLEKCKRERIDFEKSMLNEWDPIKKRLMTIEKNIKKSIDVLGSSINECDEKEKAIKKDEIANTYAQYDISKSIPLERIFESSWLNKTCSNKKWNEELEKSEEN